MTVSDHGTWRASLVRRLLSGDPGTYGPALRDARRYRAALGGARRGG
ncbi:hypothetical protein RQM47_16410 [Rubrivirga sp. S365]|nr:hypothetical protein [Rubrivirga sp. S365]MDT7858233.1 hypothetical protein [Rubrivirga sp. S365]